MAKTQQAAGTRQTDQARNLARGFLDAVCSSETVAYLVERWADERQFESLADYQKPLDRIAARAGVTITRMTGRPFGCRFVAAGVAFTLALYADGRVKLTGPTRG
jgi:hypothetical protein